MKISCPARQLEIFKYYDNLLFKSDTKGIKLNNMNTKFSTNFLKLQKIW